MAAAEGDHLNRNKYLSVVMAGAVLLGMSVGAVAQNPPSPMQGAQQAPMQAPQQAQPPTMDQRMARLTQVLNLTPAQQQQIRPVLEDAQSKMNALAADTATPMADRQAKAQALRETVRSKIDAVLTPEQKQKVQAASQRGPGGPPAQPPAQPQGQSQGQPQR